MTWRTCASPRASSARRAYSTRAVGFMVVPPETRPRYCGASASSRISRRPRASLVAVPRDGVRSPRTSREIVEWSTPDACASWRCDIFLALSWARSHSLKGRPVCVVMSALSAPWSRGRCRVEVTIGSGAPGNHDPLVLPARAGRQAWRAELRAGPIRRRAPLSSWRDRLADATRSAPGGHLLADLAPAAAERRDRVVDPAQDDDREDADRPVDERDRGRLRQRDPVGGGQDARRRPAPRSPGRPG